MGSVTPDAPTMVMLRRARTGRRVGLVLLALLVLVGASTWLGPHTSTTSVSAGGYTVVVTYPAVTRPGLPIRWEFLIRHAGGFDKDVTLSTTFDYVHLFDVSNVEP